MKKIQNGFLISLEGVDGSGKSTLARALYEALVEEGYACVLTKEPGGTPLGELIRPVVLHRTCRIDAKAEYLLFAAGRAQHFDEVIIPALDEGKIVISDRMADSSLVYQGYSRGLDLETLQAINTWTMSNHHPSLTFYLKLPLDKAMERIAIRNKGLTDFERTDLLGKNIEGFEQVFKNKSHVVALDATENPHRLLEQALVTVLSHCERP